MKQWIATLQSALPETLGVVLLVLIYAWSTQWALPPTGPELHLIEAAREALVNKGLYYPTYNEALHVPVSPLLTVLTSLGFKLFSASVLLARTLALVIAMFALVMFYMLGSRVFHPGVGLLSTSFLFASWGFFTNSQTANGSTLYMMLVLIILLLFYHWFDSAFRSRTYAKSLYAHFIAIGAALGLAFCTVGVPGVLFPAAVMVTTVLVGGRPEIYKDVHYSWLLVPFGVIAGVWTLLGLISIGPWPTLVTLFRLQPSFHYLLEPFIYLLPILPFVIPGLLSKDIWNRALLTYQKGVWLLLVWMAWAWVFLLFCGDYHEAFSLLATVPALLWIGFYLSEVFRNPLMPMGLQLVVDGVILAGLVLGIVVILLTIQMVPPDLFPGFLALSFVLPFVSLFLLIMRDFTISRSLPFYIIPCSLLLCLLAKLSLAPLFTFEPVQALARHLPLAELEKPHSAVIEWVPEAGVAPSMVRFLTPLKNQVIPVSTMPALEASIQTRQGAVYVILPERQYYALPYTVREEGYPLARSWRWRQPMSLGTLWHVLRNDMQDFKALSEPVILMEIPALPDSLTSEKS